MFLGIDTSNYTTSLALYDGKDIIQKKQLLTVKSGERGIRQSEAVFQHTVNLPKLFESMKKELTKNKILAIGVSNKPRNLEGSYMPCFLSGEACAVACSSVLNVPLFKTSHQIGHILSALYSADKLELLDSTFVAFHLSGGTTEALLVTHDDDEIIDARIIAQSSDLKAGQAVDRVGVMLGLKFPCGQQLEELALKSKKTFKITPSFSGLDCSLSGIENKCKKMLEDGEESEDIAKFCILSVLCALDEMTARIINKYGELPLVFAGGVMSNTIIRNFMEEKYLAFFAKAEFSCDNAAGCAIMAKLKSEK